MASLLSPYYQSPTEYSVDSGMYGGMGALHPPTKIVSCPSQGC